MFACWTAETPFQPIAGLLWGLAVDRLTGPMAAAARCCPRGNARTAKRAVADEPLETAGASGPLLSLARREWAKPTRFHSAAVNVHI